MEVGESWCRADFHPMDTPSRKQKELSDVSGYTTGEFNVHFNKTTTPKVTQEDQHY